MERVKQGPNAEGWDPVEADLLRTADELTANACIQDDTWARLSTQFDTRQLIDIVYAVGCYELAAMVFKSFGVALEPSVDPLTPTEQARMHNQ